MRTGKSIARIWFPAAIAAVSGLAALRSTSIALAQEPQAAASELTEQQRLRAQGPGGGLTRGVELPNWPEAPNRLARSAPVTDELLRTPSPNDWLTWRGTREGLGFSPL